MEKVGKVDVMVKRKREQTFKEIARINKKNAIFLRKIAGIVKRRNLKYDFLSSVGLRNWADDEDNMAKFWLKLAKKKKERKLRKVM